MTTQTFDWIPRYDERSRSFAVPATTGTLAYKYWSTGPVLDQGSEGACVGHGVVGALIASPLGSDLRDPQAAAFGFYRAAQFYDEWAGESYEGTSVLAGMKIAKMMGEITEYQWCFGFEQVLSTLSYVGPVVIGVNWHEGMMTPDRSGLIKATGAVVGGHCVFVTGFSRSSKRVRIRQSWGTSHGVSGNVWISFDDMSALLQAGGEAAVPKAA